jgi:hypothetical protein
MKYSVVYPMRLANLLKKLAVITASLFLVLAFTGSTLGQVRPNENTSTYIIVFNENERTDSAADALARAHNLRTLHKYNHAIKGMSAEVPEGRLNGLRNDPRVAYIEKDQVVSIFSQTTPTGIRRIFADGNENLNINGTDDVRVDADVAVIDTGVDQNHPDINLFRRTNCASGGPFNKKCNDDSGTDGNGHGTHVAGTIGAIDNGIGVVGVAPGVRIWSVRVLDNSGSGYMSWIIAGIDWVTANASEIEVANMSLGCECTSAALNTAISNSVDAGITYVVAAGNSNKDASTFSPANHPKVITVSALADFDGLPGGLGSPTCRTDEDDTLANFSNWGELINVTAPGVCITSTWKGGGYSTISGTSMASPHVAGAAAVLSVSGNYTPLQIRNTLVANGNDNWVDDSGDGFKERLLDVRNTTVFNPATVPGGGTTLPTPTPTEQPEGFVLSTNGYKVKGVQHADLFWNGTDMSIDVFRDGNYITSTANDGVYTDNIGRKGGGSYIYKVCETETPVCSNESIVNF